MGSSFYLQLAPYLLLEFTYGDQTTTYISSQVKLARILNTYLNGQVQFLNTSPSQNITQNVLDTSAANIGGYKWAFLDKDVPVPYINTDTNLAYADLSNVFTSTYVMYDRVRLHLLSGYRLEDLQGLIAQVYVKEAQTSKISVFANNVYLNSDDRDVFNSKPILLGDRMYDRYIEFFVPSLKAANTVFYSNPANAVSIGYQYSSNNRGFLYNSAIYVKVYEISSIEKKNGNMFLYTSDTYEVNVNQEDVYSLLTANIEEASDGDYFIYYPAYDGNFVEDFISDLNANGGDHVIINDIDIYEQVGLENLLTYSFSQVQQSGFDGPLEFRPICKYADSAVTLSVDYTVRIYNRENGFQIIRRASVTSFSPKKYGKSTDKIALGELSYPMKVYNKVYGNSSVTFNNSDSVPTKFTTVYVPVFYDSKKVLAQVKSLLATGADPLSPDFESSLFFGQGDARIYLSDFDSYFKFAVNEVDPATGALKKLDLSAGTIQIAFKDLNGNMIKFSALESTSESLQTHGELVFKIPGYIRSKVLEKTPSNFYLVSTFELADTILYTGSVDNIENINKETARIKELFSKIVSTQGATSSGNSNENTGNTTNTLSEKFSATDAITFANASATNAAKQYDKVKNTDIPGYATYDGSVSVRDGIVPVSLKKDSLSSYNATVKLITPVEKLPTSSTSTSNESDV